MSYSSLYTKIRLLLLFAALLTPGSPASSQVAIIAHKQVGVDALSRTQLIDFYTGDAKHWLDGKPVVMFTMSFSSAARDSFFKLMGRSPSRMKSIWMKRMLSGEGDPPERLGSEAAIVQKVASTPGAIGYVSPDTAETRSVKLIKILMDE